MTKRWRAMTYRDLEAWDRRHEAEHPEEYYEGFRLLPVVRVEPDGSQTPMVDVYDTGLNQTLCTVATAERARGWIDGQRDVAQRLLEEILIDDTGDFPRWA